MTSLANAPSYAAPANKRTAFPFLAARGALGKEKQLKISGGVQVANLPQNRPTLGVMDALDQREPQTLEPRTMGQEPGSPRPQFLSNPPYYPWD